MTSASSQPVWSGVSNSVEQTIAIGRAVAQHARVGDIIALFGELGTGKTRFVRGVAGGLGIHQMDVTSPTFVLIHEYEPPAGGIVLVHIDAYRLRGPADLESIGWDGNGPCSVARDAVVVIEWADRLNEQLGEDCLRVTLEHHAEAARRITIAPIGTWIGRMRKLQRALNASPHQGHQI